MAQHRTKPREYFTVDEANAMLPLVRAIAADLAELSRDVVERRRRLSALQSGRQPDKQDIYQQELMQVEKDLERDAQRVREYVEELRALGVEPVHGPDGIVSFPSMLDGRRVCLSWRLGEPEILFWYDPDCGYRRRQPLDAESISAT